MTDSINQMSTETQRPKKIMKPKIRESPTSKLPPSIESAVPDKGVNNNTLTTDLATMTKNSPKVQDTSVLDYSPYEIRDRKLVYYDSKAEKYVVVGRMISIQSVLKNIDTDELLIVLEFDTVDGINTMELSRGKLTKLKISELLKYGADVMEHQIKHVLPYLNYQERNAEVCLIHDRVGWDNYNGAVIFKLAQALGCNSTYRGNLQIAPQGTLDQWKKIVTEQVMGNTPMELALVIGLSAPIVPLIAKETGLEVLLFHIYGDSTRGKTTATMVATSPFGFPHTSGDGLIKTWNGTMNAIIGHFRNNHGLPMGLDEASMSGGDDFSRFIYLLASGRDKDRLNKEGASVETAQWSTTIISNAEHSLLGKSKQNIGIQMRLLEIGNTFWTTSAQNADALKEGLLKNYGQAGPIFVQYLMEVGSERIIAEWHEQRSIFYEAMTEKNNFSHRIANKMAIVMLTAKLAKEALNLDFDYEAIQSFLCQTENVSLENSDLGETAYNILLEYYTRNFSRFSNNSEELNNDLWGKRDKASNTICILPAKFKEIMTEAGFDDTRVILANWKDKGWLDHDVGKNTRKKMLNGLSQRVYAIKLKKESLSDTPSRVPSRKIISSSSVPIAELFSKDQNSEE